MPSQDSYLNGNPITTSKIWNPRDRSRRASSCDVSLCCWQWWRTPYCYTLIRPYQTYDIIPGYPCLATSMTGFPMACFDSSCYNFTSLHNYLSTQPQRSSGHSTWSSFPIQYHVILIWPLTKIFVHRLSRILRPMSQHHKCATRSTT
jgi:hypothetical protein